MVVLMSNAYQNISVPELSVTSQGGNVGLKFSNAAVDATNSAVIASGESYKGAKYAIRYVGDGVTDASFSNLDFYSCNRGIVVLSSNNTYINDINFDGLLVGSNTQYGQVFRIGGKGHGDIDPTTNGVTYIQDVVADGNQDALTNYFTDPNNDFLNNERGNGDVYLRDINASDFSDGIIDNKGRIFIMNATLEDSYRVLRAHEGAEIYLVNCEINSGPGTQALAWLKDSGSYIYHYNTTWNGKSEPSPEEVRGTDLISHKDAFNHVVKLKSDPLEGLDPFFETTFDTVFLEKLDKNDNWVTYEHGELGSEFSPVGYPEYDFTAARKAGETLRISFSKDGERNDDYYVVDFDTLEVTTGIWQQKSVAEPTVEASVDSVEEPGSVVKTSNWAEDFHRQLDEIFDEFLSGVDMAGGHTIVGDKGANKLKGSRGDDLLDGRSGADQLKGGRGDDILYGRKGNDKLLSSDGDDFIAGGAGDDFLKAGDGNDVLIDGSGADHLFGGKGDDILVAMSGLDFLSGGRGKDQFRFFANSEEKGQHATMRGGEGVDTLSIYLDTNVESLSDLMVDRREELTEAFDSTSLKKGTTLVSGENWSVSMKDIEHVEILDVATAEVLLEVFA